MNIRTDRNGIEVKIGDFVWCYSMEGHYVIASHEGYVTESDGKIFVGDNPLAIGNAEYVEVITEEVK
jgi:hypothetical protein